MTPPEVASAIYIQESFVEKRARMFRCNTAAVCKMVTWCILRLPTKSPFMTVGLKER